MDTETLTVLQKGEDFEIIVEHDQSGSAYGITLSKNGYEQLRQHFVVGRSEELKCEHKGRRTATELVEYCEDCKKILFHP